MKNKKLEKKYKIATEFIAFYAHNAGKEVVSKLSDSMRANKALELANTALAASSNSAKAKLSKVVTLATVKACEAKSVSEHAETAFTDAKDFWESFNKKHYDKYIEKAQEALGGLGD